MEETRFLANFVLIYVQNIHKMYINIHKIIIQANIQKILFYGCEATHSWNKSVG